MHFLRTPLELLPRSAESHSVSGVKLEVNELRAREDGSQAAVGLGQYETLPVSLSSLIFGLCCATAASEAFCLTWSWRDICGRSFAWLCKNGKLSLSRSPARRQTWC